MSKLETKIAALLAKAEGTTNPHEAEVFMAKAEELMLRHGIERAQLESKKRPGQKREDIVTVRIRLENGHGYAPAQAAVCHALSDAFNVKSLQTILSDSGRIIFYIGHESDVAKVEALAKSLVEQARNQALAWWRTEGKAEHPHYTDNEAYLARREFIYSFANGARERLAETRNRVVEEAEAGTALVLADRKAIVESWIDENMNVGSGRRTNRRHGSYSAARSGRQAGREAVAPKRLES